MRVDYDSASDTECISQHDIRGLSRNAAERQEILHCPRYFPAIDFQYPQACRFDAFCFITEKAGRANIILKFLCRNFDEILWSAILSKQGRRDDIHALIGALGR